MRHVILISVFFSLFLCAFAQKERKFSPYSLGFYYSRANADFFNGYDQFVFQANVRSGLPVYNDWPYFNSILVPSEYNQIGGWYERADPVRDIRLKFSGYYVRRVDSLELHSGFAVNDTVYYRTMKEKTNFIGLSFAAKKAFHPLKGNKFSALVGVEIESMFSPGSDINFYDFAVDLSQLEYVYFSSYQPEGNSRLNAYASGIIGLEMILLKHLVFAVDFRTGMGLHMVFNQQTRGLSRIAWNVGVGYHF